MPMNGGISPNLENAQSIEMGNDVATLTCTHGKIALWMGRKATSDTIKRILMGVSAVDSCITHEFDIVCDFNSIQQHENSGFVLVFYARAENGKYRVTFSVPFSKQNALMHFADTIIDRLKTDDQTCHILWSGSNLKMGQLFKEFETIDGWRLRNVETKEKEDSS